MTDEQQKQSGSEERSSSRSENSEDLNSRPSSTLDQKASSLRPRDAAERLNFVEFLLSCPKSDDIEDYERLEIKPREIEF